MVDKRMAAQLLQRLAGLDWYPSSNPEAIKDLSSALMAARSDAIAMSVVDDWVASYPQAPKPSELRQLVASENRRIQSEMDRRIAECRICDGAGYTFFTRGIYSYAAPCRCRKGEAA